MNKRDYPEIDVSMLDRPAQRAEPKLVLWARRAPPMAQPDAPASKGTGAAALEWSKQRRQAPLGRLLPATKQWAHTLPRNVVPHALLARFPRIANQLCRNWGEPAGRDYLYELLVDRRGARRGFPQEVLDELLRLRTHYDSLEPVVAIKIARHAR